MKRKLIRVVVGVLLMAVAIGCTVGVAASKKELPPVMGRDGWYVHDMNRPRPAVITPGARPGDAPSDAIVLFDGKDGSQWAPSKDGNRKMWKVANGYLEAVKGSKHLATKQSFGSCQLHIEWATPKVVVGDGQKRGNSGIYFMGLYEFQVLDSYDNITYADGQAAAIYGQNPPMVNVCRGPGKWQTYDIIFHRPVFKGGKMVKPATLTAFHNGVLVQYNWAYYGPTKHRTDTEYGSHANKLPIKLQDHGNPTRYRNIWIREL